MCMKKYLILLFLVPVLLSVSGCDFFRTVAGRPTSADLEKKRGEVLAERQRLREEAVRDSLEKAEVKRKADSLAEAALEARLLDSLSRKKGTFLRPVRLGGLGKTVLDHRYYVVTGSFKSPENAGKKARKCTEAGYSAVVIPFRNGMNAVGACPSDRISETVRNMDELKQKGICPKEGWILVNDTL